MFGLRGNGSNLGAVRQIVFAEKSLFIEAEVARDGANEATIEHAARELAPIFVFQASRKREPMRVAAVISSSVTSRSSRSRFRRSPKFPLAMLCPCRGECNSDGGLDLSAGAQPTSIPGRRKRRQTRPRKRSGDAASLGLTIGGVRGSVKRGARKSEAHVVFPVHAGSEIEGGQDSLSDERVGRLCVAPRE